MVENKRSQRWPSISTKGICWPAPGVGSIPRAPETGCPRLLSQPGPPHGTGTAVEDTAPSCGTQAQVGPGLHPQGRLLQASAAGKGWDGDGESSQMPWVAWEGIFLRSWGEGSCSPDVLAVPSSCTWLWTHSGQIQGPDVSPRAGDTAVTQRPTGPSAELAQGLKPGHRHIRTNPGFML